MHSLTSPKCHKMKQEIDVSKQKYRENHCLVQYSSFFLETKIKIEAKCVPHLFTLTDYFESSSLQTQDVR